MKAETGPALALSIILVNFNDAAHLLECLSSIEANSGGVDCEVIVVDNASTDGSAALVAERFPRVRFIRNDKNEGFGRANNRAVRESRGEFLLFINTDVVLHPGALELLMEEMRTHSDTGVVGPALLAPAGSFQASFGGRTSFFAEFAKKGLLNRNRTRSLRKDRSRREVRWVSGAFFLARRQAFLEAGGFDERFFLYFEDIDLCERILGKEWRVIFLPDAASLHHGGASTSARPLRSRVEYRKSQIRFYRKHGSAASLFLLKAYLRLSLAGLSLSGAFGRDPDGAAIRSEFREALRGAKGVGS
ncbi:MAG TPA: glycosyltransferase family 2 protein [Acidobacteriota bacterium]|nr:glycosyltransferase family 2 protein [Acidobacteriota bacterium]